MAKDRIISLVGGIGEFSVSHDYVKYLMGQLGAGPITVQCTSLGGDVNQALLIKALFETQGEVTLEYLGFNASAATIIGHGAVKTMIREDSMYLVHKPAMWVDTYGRMNADEIAAAIKELEGTQKDAEKVTLMIAQDYVNSRGMEMSAVMDLMKDARWLTAKEAVELGLVDELLPTTKKKAAVTNEVLAMLSVNGYPVPEPDNDDVEENLITKIINRISPPKTTQMNKDFSFINSVLAVEGVEVKDNKISMSVEHLTALNAAMKTKDEAVTNLTTERDTAVTDKGTAETALNEVTTQLDAIDPTVKAAATAELKVAAITAKLAARPAVQAAKPHGTGSETTVEDATEWDVINALPHNQEADRNI